MKQLLIFLINPCIPLFIYIVGCNSSAQTKINGLAPNTATVPQNSKIVQYDSIKALIKKEKLKIANNYANKETPNYTYAAQQFSYLWQYQLIPQWMGTAWDFNGTTKIPKTGNIACGYFVTTTLNDMGVNINIAKYAQCGSEVMMKYLVGKENYALYNNYTFTTFIEKLKSKKPFLAIVGLDFHTGYLLYTGKELYFIHSSYIKKRGVIQQIAADSPELKISKWRSVAFLTDDTTFLKNWLKK